MYVHPQTRMEEVGNPVARLVYNESGVGGIFVRFSGAIFRLFSPILDCPNREPSDIQCCGLNTKLSMSRPGPSWVTSPWASRDRSLALCVHGPEAWRCVYMDPKLGAVCKWTVGGSLALCVHDHSFFSQVTSSLRH